MQGNDRQLHRGDDGFFRREFVTLVWPGLVGMALANARRRTRDRHLVGLLQKEVCAQAKNRHGVSFCPGTTRKSRKAPTLTTSLGWAFHLDEYSK